MNKRDEAAYVAAFEQLCRDTQVPSNRVAAEAELEMLRKRDDVVQMFMLLVERCESPQAVYHAAAALRSGVLVRWRVLTPAERSNVRMWALQIVVRAPPPGLQPFVRRAVLRVASGCFRRAHTEESRTESDAFIAQLAHAAASDGFNAIAASECLELCAEEFIVPSKRELASAEPMELEMLRRARPAFLSGNGLVVQVFRAAKDALRHAVAQAHCLQPAEFEAVCTPALSLLARVLTPRIVNLDSDHNDNDNEKVKRDGQGAAAQELPSVLRVDASWKPLIEQVLETTQLAFQVIECARKYPQGDVEDLTDHARQVILGASAVSRSSYPTEQAAASTLQVILSTIEQQQWCTAEESTERLAYAEVWRQVSCSHGLEGLSPFGTHVFDTFAEKTCSTFRKVAIELVCASQDELYSVLDSADLLLETWAAFSYDSRANEASVLQVLQPLFEKVFMEYVHLSMKSIHAERLPQDRPIGGLADELEEEDMGFDDTSAEESRWASAAALGRLSIQKCAIFLAKLTQELAERVFYKYSAETPMKATISTIAQEDLYFAIHLVTAVLADADEREIPSVPDALRKDMMENVQELNKTAGHSLFSVLVRVATMETNILKEKGAHSNEASPRVGRAILDAFQRVARTYLVPDSTDIAFDVIGGEQFANQARIYALNKALEAVNVRSFDPEMAEAAANLMRTLARAARNYQDVRNSDLWPVLLASGIEAYQRLSPEAVEDIASALTCVLDDSSISDRLVVPAVRALPGLVARQNELPDVAERCIACITLLKGVARCPGVGQKSFAALMEALGDFEGSVKHVATLFQPDRFEVARVALNLVDDMLRDRLGLLEVNDANRLLTAALGLVAVHAESVRTHVKHVALDDCVRSVQCILELLQHIVDERPAPELAQYALRGLSALLPCMSEEFLAYPAMKKGYFDLVTSLASTYPLSVLALQPELRAQVLASLRLELFSRNTRAERKGLEAVAQLARNARHGDSDVAKLLAELCAAIVVAVARGAAFGRNIDAAADAVLLMLSPHNAQPCFDGVASEMARSGASADDIKDIVGNLRTRAGMAQQQPCNSVADRRAAARQFKEAVLEFSVRCRDALLKA